MPSLAVDYIVYMVNQCLHSIGLALFVGGSNFEGYFHEMKVTFMRWSLSSPVS